MSVYQSPLWFLNLDLPVMSLYQHTPLCQLYQSASRSTGKDRNQGQMEDSWNLATWIPQRLPCFPEWSACAHVNFSARQNDNETFSQIPNSKNTVSFGASVTKTFEKTFQCKLTHSSVWLKIRTSKKSGFAHFKMRFIISTYPSSLANLITKPSG